MTTTHSLITLKDREEQYSFEEFVYDHIRLYCIRTGKHLYLTPREYSEHWVKGVLNPGKIKLSK